MAHRMKMFSRLKNWHPLPKLLLLVAVLIVIGLAWHWHGSPSTDTMSGETSTAPASLSQASLGPQSNHTDTNNGKSPVVSNVTSSGPLAAPDRVTYVSNHTPSSATVTELSSFITAPGASCQIKFTMNSVTKNLPTKIADSSGSVIWYWTPSQAGLTAGSWQVSAAATLNSHAQSSSDVIPLQIP